MSSLNKHLSLDEAVRQCAAEPIAFPGAIQDCGALLIIDHDTQRVVAASENLADLLGCPAADALGQRLDGFFARPERLGAAVDAPAAAPNPIRMKLSGGGQVECVVAPAGQAVSIELYRAERAVPAMPMPIDNYLGFLNSIESQRGVPSMLDAFLRSSAETVRAFSGFDRAMIYQFLPDGSGEVVAESIADGLDPYLGLRYPASDIPSQARELYRRNAVRVIPDVGYTPVPLIGAAGVDPTGIDLSMCGLRSVSPVHIQYLKNMSAGATLVSSILWGGELWGLIACHHDSPRRVTFPLKQSFSVLSRQIGAQLGILRERDGYWRMGHARSLLQAAVPRSWETLATEELDGFGDAMLEAFEADGATLRLGDATIRRGACPLEADEQALHEAIFRALGPLEVFLTTSLPADLPDCPSDERVRGVLAFRVGDDCTVALWRRPIQETIRWAGKPDKAVEVADDGALALRPRASFAEWAEQNRDKARPWTEHERMLVADCRNALSEGLVRHSEHLARVNRELASRSSEMESFVYSVSHDLQSPIVSLRGFVELLREDVEDGRMDEVAHYLSRIDNLTNRLTTIIDEMLELSRIGHLRTGRSDIKLTDLCREVVAAQAGPIRAAGATVHVQPDMPKASVYRSPAQRALENLLTNALKYACRKPGGRIEFRARALADGGVELLVRDNGPGIPVEYREQVFKLFRRLESDRTGSGIGLALVAKVAEVHGGRATVTEAANGGAEFILTLPAEPRAGDAGS